MCSKLFGAKTVLHQVPTVEGLEILAASDSLYKMRSTGDDPLTAAIHANSTHNSQWPVRSRTKESGVSEENKPLLGHLRRPFMPALPSLRFSMLHQAVITNVFSRRKFIMIMNSEDQARDDIVQNFHDAFATAT